MKRQFNQGFTLLELLIVLAIMIMIISMGVPSLQRMLARAQFKAGVVELQTELYQTRLLAMKTGKPYIFRYQAGTNLYEIMPKDILQQAIFQQNASSFSYATTGRGFGELSGMGTNSTNSSGNISDDVFALSDDLLQNPLSQTRESDQNLLFVQKPNASNTDFETAEQSSSEFSDSSTENSLKEIDQPDSKNAIQTKSTEFGVISRKILTHNIIFGLGTISKSTPANLQTETPLQDGQEIATDLGSSFVGTLDAPSERDAQLRDVWSEPIVFYPNGRTSSAVFFLLSNGPFEFYSEMALRGITGIPRISAISSVPPDDPNFPSSLSQEAIVQLYQSQNPTNQEDQLKESMIFDQDNFADSSFDSDETSGYLQPNPTTPPIMEPAETSVDSAATPNSLE